MFDIKEHSIQYLRKGKTLILISLQIGCFCLICLYKTDAYNYHSYRHPNNIIKFIHENAYGLPPPPPPGPPVEPPVTMELTVILAAWLPPL